MPDADETTETSVVDEDTTDTPTDPDDDGHGETFDRAYVERIRRESAGYRDRAKTAEGRVQELSRALFTARVEATGALADATDLEYDADLVDDHDGLTAAINGLTEAKPHLKARKVSGDAGLGVRGDTASFSLVDALKGTA